MDAFHLPPPLLPDIVSTHTSVPPPPPNYQKPQLTNLDNVGTSCQEPVGTNIDESVVQMMEDCSIGNGIVPEKVVEEFEQIMSNEDDKVVLTNSICLLFRFSIDSVRGFEVCRAMSASPEIMNRLYYVLTNDEFKNDDLIQCYATGNLTNISKYEEGRAALLGCNGSQYGVESLISSLQSRDSNVIIFAITALHNLLLDRRVEIQELAKERIKHGLGFIVQLLDYQHFMNNYEFKVIVLDCLQILAYGSRENRLAIKRSGGPYLLLKTIKENFDNQPTEQLVETASRVLKSLSACPENKIDIIKYDGVNILTHCIGRNNQEILKTCLWTLRNLSDLINNNGTSQNYHINQLVERLLYILYEYAEEPCIITCVLGILANLTCNNEAIKQLICECNGLDLILKTVGRSLNGNSGLRVIDRDILEPAICTICHLMNQSSKPELAESVKLDVSRNLDLFEALRSPYMLEDELSKAADKLIHLVYKS